MAFDVGDRAALAAFIALYEQQHNSIGRAVHAHGEDWLIVAQVGVQAVDGSCLALAVRAHEQPPTLVHLIQTPPRLPQQLTDQTIADALKKIGDG